MTQQQMCYMISVPVIHENQLYIFCMYNNQFVAPTIGMHLWCSDAAGCTSNMKGRGLLYGSLHSCLSNGKQHWQLAGFKTLFF